MVIGLQQRKRREDDPASQRLCASAGNYPYSMPPREPIPNPTRIALPTPLSPHPGLCCPFHRVPRLTPWATFFRCSAPRGGTTRIAMGGTFRCEEWVQGT
jgi:hypothetical protein